MWNLFGLIGTWLGFGQEGLGTGFDKQKVRLTMWGLDQVDSERPEMDFKTSLCSEPFCHF